MPADRMMNMLAVVERRTRPLAFGNDALAGASRPSRRLCTNVQIAGSALFFVAQPLASLI
jgi:hypothetical protein